MDYKKMIPYINGENELSANVVQLAEKYSNEGGDGLFLYNYSKDEKSRSELLAVTKEIVKEVDIPIMLGIYAERFEDVKKAVYAGAAQVVIKQSLMKEDIIQEAAERFGNDKIIIEMESVGDFQDFAYTKHLKDLGVWAVLLKHVTISDALLCNLDQSSIPVLIRDSLVRNDLSALMKIEPVIGVVTNHFENKSLMKGKQALKTEGISVNTFELSIPFGEMKVNEAGLIPVVVQDYKTGEVLMVAYANEEALQMTVDTGKMTYFSRSRNKLWCKGETSGHFQYVKALLLDCDRDTILAKVKQVGPACHTGNRSCFYTELMKREFNDINPATVLNEVYEVIMDRRSHPREGSYTNYLFDKGLDKILKKCGEEATEIVIAAKNPDAEELKYEISDFLYHLMVLMAECGLDWNDVMKELAYRR